ncbi:MAG TPA: energy transducer TonB [Flavobacterium sp.]|jgi:antitoxin component YwqK of YwqJK toxin-antitoxin module
MKVLLATFIFVLAGFSATFAQSKDDLVIYLDSSNTKTTIGNYVTRRVIENSKKDHRQYIIKDYYKSGKLKSEGITLSADSEKYDGPLTSFYENGNKMSVMNYSAGWLSGEFFSWYELGAKKVEGKYFAPNLKEREKVVEQIIQYWDKDGVQKVIDGNGYYEEIHDNFSQKGKIKYRVKDSIWTGIDKKLKITFSDEYMNGEFAFGTSIDSKGGHHSYREIDELPVFPKGIKGFRQHVANNFRIPNERSLRGRLIATFLISESGEITDTKVLQDLGHGTAEEAKRVIEGSARWKPARRRGIPIPVRFSIPIAIFSESSYNPKSRTYR